jgi:hypothetical protein
MGKGISPAPCGLIIKRIESMAEELAVVARPTTKSAACPSCGHFHKVSTAGTSASVRPAILGKLVWIKVRACRFRCGQTDCRRRIFVDDPSVFVKPLDTGAGLQFCSRNR